MTDLLSSFTYWYVTQCSNSWVFRLATLALALLLVATAAYAGMELYRCVRPSAQIDRWCTRLFLIWVCLLEAFLTCLALLYLLGARLVLI